MAKDNLQLENKIDKLIDVITSHQVAPVLPVAPIAPIAPVLPLVPHNSGDHDFLLTFSSEVKTKLDVIDNKIQMLTDGTAMKINDHETRLRTLEKEFESESTDHALVKKVVYGAVAMILLSVMSAIIYLVVHK